jgi:imidazole glycerol-phosphate synthase subunit HisH
VTSSSSPAAAPTSPRCNTRSNAGSPRASRRTERIRAATHVILPGVGAAANAMQRLRAAKLDRVIPQLTQPVLGICLGMQLLFDASAEGAAAASASSRARRAIRRGPGPAGSAHGLEHARIVESGSPLLEGSSTATMPISSTASRCRRATRRSRRPSTAAAVQRLRAVAQFFRRPIPPERSAAVGARLLRNFWSCNDAQGRALAHAPDSFNRPAGRPLRAPAARRLRYRDALFEPIRRSSSRNTAVWAPTGSTSSISTARATAARAIARSSSASRRKTRYICRSAAACAIARPWPHARVGSRTRSRRQRRRDPVDAVREWLVEFGAERIALAFDVRLDQAGSAARRDARLARAVPGLAVGAPSTAFRSKASCTCLCTDVRRDGALTGPNVDLYREAVRRFPNIEWQASGGVRDLRDLAALADAGSPPRSAARRCSTN